MKAIVRKTEVGFEVIALPSRVFLNEDDEIVPIIQKRNTYMIAIPNKFINGGKK